MSNQAIELTEISFFFVGMGMMFGGLFVGFYFPTIGIQRGIMISFIGLALYFLGCLLVFIRSE